MHDLVIRTITKYLQWHNQELVNLHLISRRFYKIREMFVKRITYVLMKIDTIHSESVRITFKFIAPFICYTLIKRYKKQSARNKWIRLRRDITKKETKYLYFSTGIDLDDEATNVNLSCSVYGKSLVKCLSVLIEDPRFWNEE